jgi:glucose/arabinose dehydrogenase
VTNNSSSAPLEKTAAVLRMNPSGSAVTTNPFYNAKNTGTKRVRNYIYGYGIRNSFGIDIDPVTGTLWETENGPNSFDEINRITPGFNGGWTTILGPTSRNGKDPAKLVSFGERAHYEDPKFSWLNPVAPTDAFFMPNARLGSKYKNDLFVATYKGGNILHFDLSPSRKTLALAGVLGDQVADNSADHLFAEQESVLFASGFGRLTDLVAGPGGMYALSYDRGIIYRITTDTTGSASISALGVLAPEPNTIWMIIALCLPLKWRARRRGVATFGRLGRNQRRARDC